ncbi:MAG: Gfo/Idh/MocA family oxidoreductase [Rhodobacteraceae bacterium]|nr:Gfo/Idh/MocA family oxidoreductase [Paracoccaceae bacterium]
MLLPDSFDPDRPFPPLTRRLRLGVVGGGRIAQIHAMAARLTGRWEITAGAFSADSSRAGSAAAEWRLPRCYESYDVMATREAMLADGIDAVVITTPNHLHAPVARAFLEAGIDVLCEKPMTGDVSQALSLVKLTGKTDRIFVIAYVHSCFPMIRMARAIIAEGGIGAINQIHAEYIQEWPVTPEARNEPHIEWRLDPARSGPTSCLADLGTHAVHLTEFVSRLPLTHVRAEFHVCVPPKPMEDTVFAWTRHSAAIPGTLMVTRHAPGNPGGLRLRIFGTEGGLEWALDTCGQLKFSRYGEADRIFSKGQGPAETEHPARAPRGFHEGNFGAWATLYTEFAIAVAARRDGFSLPADSLGMPTVAAGADGMRFIDACVRSNEADGGWVAI